MIYVLYGEDTYRSRKKLNEIISEYRSKIGSDLDFHRLDASDSDFAVLENVSEIPSLFTPKKLIVVENAFLKPANFEVLKRVVKKIKGSMDTVIILWERELTGEGKKKLGEIKSLADKIQEFKPLAREALRHWIQEESRRRGLRLYPAHTAYLELKGNDLWAISNELDKMVVGVEPNAGSDLWGERTVFQVGDTFFSSAKAALPNLLQLLQQGYDERELFSYLANHSRTLLVVKKYLEQREPVPASFGIHPYVIKKASSAVRLLPAERLQSLLHKFFEEDFRIKVGLSNPRDSLLRMLIGADRH